VAEAVLQRNQGGGGQIVRRRLLAQRRREASGALAACTGEAQRRLRAVDHARHADRIEEGDPARVVAVKALERALFVRKIGAVEAAVEDDLAAVHGDRDAAGAEWRARVEVAAAREVRLEVSALQGEVDRQREAAPGDVAAATAPAVRNRDIERPSQRVQVVKNRSRSAG